VNPFKINELERKNNMLSARNVGVLFVSVVLLITGVYFFKARETNLMSLSELYLQMEEPNSLAGKPSSVGPETAKPFAVVDIKGKRISLSDLKGKPVVLNFWATWCAPCVEEMPSFLKFSKWATQNSDAVVLAISVDETKKEITEFFIKLGVKGGLEKLPFLLALDSAQKVTGHWKVNKFPETFFIDRVRVSLQRPLFL
jgi:thiol-disulfide isomerase/thioredoxin